MTSQKRFIVVRQEGYSETELMEAPTLEKLHDKLSEKAGRNDIKRGIQQAEDIDELCEILGLNGA